MFADRLGHLLGASQPRCHQSEGVAPVERGTRPTHCLPSAATRLQQDPVRQVAGIEAHLGTPVTDPDHPSRQAHRSLASTHGPHLGFEGVQATRSIDPGDDPVDETAVVDFSG